MCPMTCNIHNFRQIFERVEEENERKAQAAEHHNQQNRPDTTGVFIGDKFATVKKSKGRRRGSVSISRIGQV